MSKPHTPKPPYSAQFREQMIELVRAGRAPSELAKEFGCHATSIHNWLRQADEVAGTAQAQSGALTASERQELLTLRRQLRQVQMERDILAKAGPSLQERARRRTRRLRTRKSKPGRTTGAHHVQNPQSLCQWLLRLARSPHMSTPASQCSADRANP